MSAEFLLAYSTIADGNMSVKWGPEAGVGVNRKKFLAGHGLKREDTVVMDLMHDDKIAVVGRGEAGRVVRAEAVLTRERGLVLFLLTADCCPVSFYDPVHNALALAHLSWQTTTLSLSKKVVAAMQKEFGTDPAALRVTIGPSARKESYIQQEVKQREHPEWSTFLHDTRQGTAIDVVGYNIAQLVGAGVSPGNIVVEPYDTIVSPEYFSHYRSVRTGEIEGRFATILVLH